MCSGGSVVGECFWVYCWVCSWVGVWDRRQAVGRMVWWDGLDNVRLGGVWSGPVAWCCDRSELVRFGAEEEEGADVMVVCFGFFVCSHSRWFLIGFPWVLIA